MQLEIPEGFIIDQEQSCLEKNEIVLKKIRPTWQDLKHVHGWEPGSPMSHTYPTKYNTSKFVFPHSSQANAVTALAQLLQWRLRVVKTWTPNWEHRSYSTNRVFVIRFLKDEPQVHSSLVVNHVLSFPSLNQADQFLQDHRELILQAKPLLAG